MAVVLSALLVLLGAVGAAVSAGAVFSHNSDDRVRSCMHTHIWDKMIRPIFARMSFFWDISYGILVMAY